MSHRHVSGSSSETTRTEDEQSNKYKIIAVNWGPNQGQSNPGRHTQQ